MFRFDTHSWMTLSVGIPCIVQLLLWVPAAFRLLVNCIAVYTSNTTRRIYYIVRFQDFTLRRISGLHTGWGTAGVQYVTRGVFHSSMLQYFQVPNTGYTMSPRHNKPSVVLLKYSQYSLYCGLQYFSNTLSTRSTKNCTRYSIFRAYLEHLLRRRLLLLLLLLVLRHLWRPCCWRTTLSRSVRRAHAVTLRNGLPI